MCPPLQQLSRRAATFLPTSRMSPWTTNPSSRTRQLCEKLRIFKALDPCLRGFWDAQGGYDKVFAELGQELSDVGAAQRCAKPLDAQKASAEAHLKKMQKWHESVAARLAELKQADIVKRIEEKEAEFQSATSKVAAAKRELASVTERIAESLRDGPAAPSVVPQDFVIALDEAALVRGLIQQIPQGDFLRTLAAHGVAADAVAARTNVLWAKCDAQAATHNIAAETRAGLASISGPDAIAVQAPAAQRQPADLDDDQVEQFAELATVVVAGEDGAARAARVAAAKAQLCARGKEVVGRVAKRQRTEADASAVSAEGATPAGAALALPGRLNDDQPMLRDYGLEFAPNCVRNPVS